MSVVFQDHDDHLCFGFEDQRHKLDHLPPAVYRLKLHKSMSGVSIKLFKDVKQFSLPERRFGRHDRIVKTFVADYDPVNPPLGLMTLGIKGSGKSMLCEDICNRMLAKGLPVILIEEPVPTDLLLIFALAVGPSVFYFDEIGKIYNGVKDGDESNTGLNQLLSFFSNQSLIGRVFLITANTKSELNQYFFDRPGRFKYRVEMDLMERDAYLEYMRAQKVPPEKMIWLEGVWMTYTFDQLRVLVPAVKASADVHELLETLKLLNVQSPWSTLFTIHGLARHGVPIRLDSRDDIKLYFEGDNIVIKLLDEEIRVPWRTTEGTFSNFIQSSRRHGENTIEIGDFTIHLDMDCNGFIPRREDLLEGTLVRKRPRINIGLKPNPVEEDEKKKSEESPRIGRGSSMSRFQIGNIAYKDHDGFVIIDG